MTPIQAGLGSLLLIAACFEPLRTALAPTLGEAVGGVGGVGGLCNLWSPEDMNGTVLCDQAAAELGAYCFHRGALLGLTPFALVVLLAWTLPLAASAGAAWWKAVRSSAPASVHVPAASTSTTTPLLPSSASSSTPSALRRNWRFVAVWAVLSCLWFALPAYAYLSAPFYRQSASHLVLGVAISAAFPLSWHLALVAVPMGGSFVKRLLGWDRKDVAACHKVVGGCTIGWAAVHAGGELIYMAAQSAEPGGEGGLAQSFDLSTNGENLLFVFGAACLSLLALHAVVTCVRHRCACLRRNFRRWHRAVAAVLLVCAAAHWWPFAFFLVPASAVHATAAAIFCRQQQRTASPSLEDESMPLHMAAAALAGALVMDAVGVAAVWAGREVYMLGPELAASPTAPYVAFLFPPAATTVGFVAGFLAAWGILGVSLAQQPKHPIELAPGGGSKPLLAATPQL